VWTVGGGKKQGRDDIEPLLTIACCVKFKTNVILRVWGLDEETSVLWSWGLLACATTEREGSEMMNEKEGKGGGQTSEQSWFVMTRAIAAEKREARGQRREREDKRRGEIRWEPQDETRQERAGQTHPLVTVMRFLRGIFLPGFDILAEVSLRMTCSQSEVRKMWRMLVAPLT
jgi:hypothetical protein